MGEFIIGAVCLLAAFIAISVWFKSMEARAFAALSPAEQAESLLGPLNPHLICPHCQTKGTVRAKAAENTVTSTGKVGGILKTNTSSKAVHQVTQHHCEKCGTTWNV